MSSNRIHLDSTVLAAATYDDSSKHLELDFCDGKRYVYSGITRGLYRDLLGAASKGTFFNRHIRGCFPYAKLPGEN